MGTFLNNPAKTGITVKALGNVTGATATNASQGNIFTATLTGNITLSNPTNATNGQAITWYLKQDGVGGHTITLDTKFNIPSSATTPLAFSTAAGAMDILAVRYDSTADKFQVVSMVPGY